MYIVFGGYVDMYYTHQLLGDSEQIPLYNLDMDKKVVSRETVQVRLYKYTRKR